MTENELVEKIARAICAADDMTDPNDLLFFDPATGEEYAAWTAYEEEAREALSVIREALREPTPEMRKAGADQMPVCFDEGGAVSDVYRAMIAASPIGEK